MNASAEGVKAEPLVPLEPILLELAHPEAINSKCSQSFCLEVFDQDFVDFDEVFAVLVGFGNGQIVGEWELNTTSLNFSAV